MSIRGCCRLITMYSVVNAFGFAVVTKHDETCTHHKVGSSTSTLCGCGHAIASVVFG